MDPATLQSSIEASFREQARKDSKIGNAYLLVHSEQRNIDLRVAEGRTGDTLASIEQPVYLASVGKLFTATIISILHEEGQLSFGDRIAMHLDPELMSGLHVYKGHDYSGEIQIRHLLNQSSGLDDCFWPLLAEMRKDPSMRITPREAILWSKEHLTPKAEPGKKHHYTDTNYYLLGLIVESITGAPFHRALHRRIFEPLGMDSAYMQGYSEPAVRPEHPLAEYYLDDLEGSSLPGFFAIDYAGGGVVAVLADYLRFMQALTNHDLIREDTLQTMLSDDYRSYPGMRYGYGIWKFVTIPLLMPAKYTCWGCTGVTGAFMFYHPDTESYIIGSFNQTAYSSKALRFMMSQVVKPIVKGR
jgi:D-alanyl-D-alanine carboxypeptidase